MNVNKNPSKLLHTWLSRQVSPENIEWLDKQCAAINEEQTSHAGASAINERALHILLGLIPRRLGKDDLVLDAADITAATASRVNWDPDGWSVDQAARVYTLLHCCGDEASTFHRLFVELCRTAEMAEAVALYKGLPLYPGADGLINQSAEGLRTNMRAVFEAIAHANPFPMEQYDDHRWNHMVLKALFIDSKLAPIQGLDRRANPELAEILIDYAHERWAADRKVTVELWRCVGPFATGARLDDLSRLIDSSDENERAAAALALTQSPDPGAKTLLTRLPDAVNEIENGNLSWDAIG